MEPRLELSVLELGPRTGLYMQSPRGWAS